MWPARCRLDTITVCRWSSWTTSQGPVGEGHALISTVTSCRADLHTSGDPSSVFPPRTAGGYQSAGFKINIFLCSTGESAPLPKESSWDDSLIFAYIFTIKLTSKQTKRKLTFLRQFTFIWSLELDVWIKKSKTLQPLRASKSLAVYVFPQCLIASMPDVRTLLPA